MSAAREPGATSDRGATAHGAQDSAACLSSTANPGGAAALPALPGPALTGRILALCSGSGGVPKRPLECAQIGPTGILGDKHRYHLHGGLDRALCLLSIEEVRSLERDGVRTQGPGTFGENVLTAGLPFSELRPGDRLTLGQGPQAVLIELFDLREPCATLRKIDRRFPDLMLGRSGYLARVLRGGRVAPGDPIVRPEQR
jgi:MOSC domain-containing protein YiiM